MRNPDTHSSIDRLQYAIAPGRKPGFEIPEFCFGRDCKSRPIMAYQLEPE